MSTISDLAQDVQNRLEEPVGSPGLFWNYSNELLSLITEPLNLATLISGEPEIRSTTATTLALNSTLQAMPAGAAALLRIESAGTMLQKSSLLKMDYFLPGWEAKTDVTLGNPGVLLNWLPVGLNQFAIYPKLTVPVQVILSYIGLPVPTGFPLTGNETVNFPREYNSGFVEGAAGLARLKEGSAEFQQGLYELDALMDTMTNLQSFGWRRGMLRVTRGLGLQGKITDTEKK